MGVEGWCAGCVDGEVGVRVGCRDCVDGVVVMLVVGVRDVHVHVVFCCLPLEVFVPKDTLSCADGFRNLNFFFFTSIDLRLMLTKGGENMSSSSLSSEDKEREGFAEYDGPCCCGV